MLQTALKGRNKRPDRKLIFQSGLHAFIHLPYRAGTPPPRRTLVADYTALCNYIVTMANAYPDDVAWDELLTAINVIRKRYADLLARRAGAKKDEQP